MPPQQLVGNSQYSNRGGAETQGENRVSATLRLFFLGHLIWRNTN